MSKGSGSDPAGRRPSLSRNAKPYDANNSFVRKMATKVTDFIPQSSWISKWFNPLQNNEDVLESRENTEEIEDDTQQPPNKRSRICMDTIHPPGTFSIQTRTKSALNTIEPSKEQYPVHNEREDFSELATAGKSGIGHLISSTPAMQADIRTVTSHKSDLNLTSSINNGIINGIDDNSESSESTSGCSSLIPQINRHEGPSNLYNSTFSSRKRHIDDKLTFTNHLQSPRSLFLDSNSRDTLSSRRPSFNASVVTNVLDRSSPLSSPFYSGNITYGGANAAGFYKQSRNLFNNSSELQLKVPRRTNVEVKPSNVVDSSGISQTAKKILEALEHFSSPISDAKKIPLKNTNNASSPIMGRKRAREEVASPSARIGMRHLTRELTVPTVPDILKLRRRQKLQDTTLAARKIVSSRSDPPPPPQEYRLRVDDADNEKYRGKLKGKSKINLEQEETVAPVNLPNVPLPITTLPNFNFTLPFPALHSAGKTVANKENTFTFASPIKMPDVEKNLQSVNNFTFSNPIIADDSASKIIDSSSYSITENVESTVFSSTDSMTTSIPNFIWSGSSTAPRLRTKIKNNKDDFIESATANEQKSGNVMNVLCSKSNKIESTLTGQSNSGLVSEMTYADKSASSDLDIKNTHDATLTWECSECLIKNSGTEKQCTACKFARPDPNDKTSTSTCSTSTIDTIVKAKPVADDCFGSQFKLSANQWECTVCCVRNKQSEVKCVACYALKPESNSAIQQTVKSQTYDLMEKFKPAEGSWECHGCLLRNSANVITCPCCNASKPTFIKTNQKKTNTATELSPQKSSTAETDNTTTQEATSSNYQVMNKSLKPTSIKTSPRKTDIVTELSPQKLSTADTDNAAAKQETTLSNEIMNKFKPSKDSWECSGCLVRNNNSVTICPCCSTSKPNSLGGSSNTDQTSTNGFGDKFKKPEGSWNCDSCLVQNDVKHTQCVACQALKPGTAKSNEPASSITNSTLQFSIPLKFGIPSGTSNLVNPSGFNFGIDKADNHSKSDTASSLNGFKFGNAQQVICNTSTNATTTCLPTFAQPTFTFSDSKTASQTTIPTFGQVPTSSAALSTNLSFGENKPAEVATSSSNKSTSDAPTATLFPIVSSSPSLFNNNESKTTIAFGTDKSSAFTTTDSNKPSGFAIPEKIPTFGSNTQDSKPTIFGTPEAKLPVVFNSPAVNPLPTFGIPSSSSTTPSLFGSSSNTAAFGNNTTPAFGDTATTPTTLFSSTKPSVETNPAPNSSLFKFGSASTQQPATAGSGFNFSANVNQASSATKPLFTFGNNSNASPNSNNMFSGGAFGANAASTSQNTSAGFAFNTPKQETPVTFGVQGASTTPIFGAPQTNPQTQATSPSFSSIPSSNTGFNFASAAPPAAASGGFNFGGMSSTSTPTGGFNFNPPTSTPTPVVFDPNSRPSFNFTKGSAPPSFNAPPQSASAPRKIKKAFRRCVR